MKVAIASDHAGYDLKEVIKKYVEEKGGYEIMDFGTYSSDSCDYADYAHPAANAVERGVCAFGIAMCGSGNGIQMTLNKHQGIRAALCWEPELAVLARQHNDANFLVMPARFITEEMAYRIVDAYLSTKFEGGRHARRVAKIPVDGAFEIELRDVMIQGSHGVLPEERVCGNQYRINVRIRIPSSSFDIESDHLSDTISYAEMYEVLTEIMSRPARMLESVATKFGSACRIRWPFILNGEIEIVKTVPPISGMVGSAGVKYEF